MQLQRTLKLQELKGSYDYLIAELKSLKIEIANSDPTDIEQLLTLIKKHERLVKYRQNLKSP